MEASVVCLLLQKTGHPFVSVARYDADNQQEFPQLLDILLSSDYHTPKLAFTPQGLFGGWTWWRRWTNASDNEPSSSECYQSVEEKTIVVASESVENSVKVSVENGAKTSMENGAKTSMENGATTSMNTNTKTTQKVNHPNETQSITKTTHPQREETCQEDMQPRSKAFFNEIHSCLDRLLTELETVQRNATVTTQLLTIVQTLLYTHLVDVVAEEDVRQGMTSIEAIHTNHLLSSPIDLAATSHEVLEGPHLLVLTESRCLLLSGIRPQPCGGSDEDVLVTITQSFLPVFSDQSPVSLYDCESFLVKQIIPLNEIQLVNILVTEEGESSGQPQIIHIKYGSDSNVYLQVDYAIFIVNELMNRIGKLHFAVCWIGGSETIVAFRFCENRLSPYVSVWTTCWSHTVCVLVATVIT